MSKSECLNGSPACSPACKLRETRAASEVLSTENILVRTRANAPANDDLLHGRARLCRSCGAETTNDRYCDACLADGTEFRTCTRCGQGFDAFGPRKAASDGLCLQCLDDDARREERAATLREQCRIHRVRRVEGLPVSVLAEMQAERGRC